MTRVVLGNRNAIESHDHGETFVKMKKGKRATVIDVPDNYGILDTLKAILDSAEGVWVLHAEADAVPAWVASDSPALAIALAEEFGGIEIRDLADPYHEDTGYKGGFIAPTALTVLALGLMLFKATPWLKTNGGQDFQANQMANSALASASAVSKWMAITANATAESASDTTLTAEIATASGGLIRQVAVFAHTTSASTYTLTGTFTANGNDSLPVTIAKMATFTASSSGTMTFEKLLTTTATLSASGDSVVVTQTVTM